MRRNFSSARCRRIVTAESFSELLKLQLKVLFVELVIWEGKPGPPVATKNSECCKSLEFSGHLEFSVARTRA